MASGSTPLRCVPHGLQDFRGDVRAVTSSSGGILEHTRYGLTGRPESFPAADVNFDGVVDSLDEDNFALALKDFSNGASNYDPRADLDRDGDVEDDDLGLFNDSLSGYGGYGGQWKLSSGAGLMLGHSGEDAGLDNRFGWRGYWYDPRLQVYHVRNRAYDPRQGQWLQTDPLGFSAGDQNLYRYADGNYASGYDPLGLVDAVPGNPSAGQHFTITTDGTGPAPAPLTPCERLAMQIQNLEKSMNRPLLADQIPEGFVGTFVWLATNPGGAPSNSTIEGGASAAGGVTLALADWRLGKAEKIANAARAAEVARAVPPRADRISHNAHMRVARAFEGKNGPIVKIARAQLNTVGNIMFFYTVYSDVQEVIDAAMEGDGFRTAHRSLYAAGDVGLGGIAIWASASGMVGPVAFGMAATPFGWAVAGVGAAAWVLDAYLLPAATNILTTYLKAQSEKQELEFKVKQYYNLQSLWQINGCGCVTQGASNNGRPGTPSRPN